MAITGAFLRRVTQSPTLGRIRAKWRQNEHRYKKIFWRLNYPVAILMYFYTSEKILLFYTLLCSVYANDETSAGADEAKKAQK